MWCPGAMSRKNRLMLSLAKQVAKGRGADATLIAVERLNHDPALKQDTTRDRETDDVESISSIGTNSSSASDTTTVDALIKERLASFIARSIVRALLRVTIASSNPDFGGELVEASLVTDANGHFEKDLFVPYEPSLVQVASVADDSICGFQEVSIIDADCLGVISDIDDTVKLTGVVGDKRELMKKLLTGDIDSWNIPSVVRWYQQLSTQCNATFHYVSNSPWQLFTLIHSYFEQAKMPHGSMHLKQYSGNIIGSLMEPSSSRKSKSLVKILEDFPRKNFICVGDSGEQDLEAYVDLAAKYPERIKGIYIRAVPNSFSFVDDRPILRELKWMVANWNELQAIKKGSALDAPPLIDLLDFATDNQSKARLMKLPPLVPAKPDNLKGMPLRKLPPLPERRYLNKAESASSLESLLARSFSDTLRKVETTPALTLSPPPPPPPRRKRPPSDVLLENDAPRTPGETAMSPDDLGSLAMEKIVELYHVNEFFELEDVDKKGALWIQRVVRTMHQLDGTNTRFEIFEDDDEAFFTESYRRVK